VPVDQRVKTGAFERGHKLISKIDIVSRIGNKDFGLAVGAPVYHYGRSRGVLTEFIPFWRKNQNRVARIRARITDKES
jgi:hypothetical protein